MEGQSKGVHVWERCYQRGRAGSSKEGEYMSESVGPNSRGRLSGRWRDRVKEYMCERERCCQNGRRAGSSKEGVYMSESVGPNSRGRPPGRWRDRVREYMCEGGAARLIHTNIASFPQL